MNSPVPFPDDLHVHPGPALLSGIAQGPSLPAHRTQYGVVPNVDTRTLTELVTAVGLRGRGGAAFPFAIKLGAVLERAGRTRRPVVVVNASEGEPASSKDTALALTRPHLVLDGAVAAAQALRANKVHVVLPGERPFAAAGLRRALAERDDPVEIVEHTAEPRFVAGQAKAVVELIEGRTNLPVTTWQPEAESGVGGRPTLLSNAETWAHVGLLVHVGATAYRRFGTSGEPGTALLSVTTPDAVPHVHEVEYGARMRDVLPPSVVGAPVLLGGFHGSWATWETVASLRVSVPGMRSLGVALGAGVVHAPGPDACPLAVTVRITDYLASQSARRCGPCLNGLPALALSLHRVLDGSGTRSRVEELASLVVRRGACAHPDGTVRLVRSLFAALPGEILAHAAGGCLAADRSRRLAS
ncbi:NADH-ubiquinone oxidoreductase-F iron-sulfur binding region domain-containing protein [uncultured Nocardioides sp.]|uniref:NADH-ubiquinone oxidoreductase-F iron-sulfur binding region domain-containing protein n=1 Tax=uncultured Nocardioides sp. TaxID=198441 RepID=UPI002614517D|nr:NADH-ubiquinone oxidoreductase-F iron-sulfur binding region domain-containing protein [uncultured Nocardioides sp.]